MLGNHFKMILCFKIHMSQCSQIWGELTLHFETWIYLAQVLIAWALEWPVLEMNLLPVLWGIVFSPRFPSAFLLLLPCLEDWISLSGWHFNNFLLGCIYSKLMFLWLHPFRYHRKAKCNSLTVSNSWVLTALVLIWPDKKKKRKKETQTNKRKERFICAHGFKGLSTLEQES